MRQPRSSIIIALILLAASLILVVAAGCSHTGGSSPRTGQSARAVAATFVGNHACAECHRPEHLKHIFTNHQATLSLASNSGLSAVTPPPGPVGDTQYRLVKTGSGISMAANGHPELTRKIDLAVGSGKFGVSYMSIQKDGLQRLRMSYLPPVKQWYVHPGDEQMDLYDPPGEFNHADSQHCLSCHAVTQPPGEFLPKKEFIGVGCEACHGPGSAHIDAARAGRKDLRVEKIKSWGAGRINEMCGRCHAKDGSDPTAPLLDPKDTLRFASNALMQSRCFIQSGDTLSCITCHDPHTNASNDHRKYDAVCLKCHSGPTTAAVTPIGKPCPVNPREKCASCHMKSQAFSKRVDIPTKMTDHYIRLPSLILGQPSSE